MKEERERRNIYTKRAYLGLYKKCEEQNRQLQKKGKERKEGEQTKHK